MKKTFILMLSILLILGAKSASASLLLYDNFNGENSGSGALNYDLFSNWNVKDGSVDLIGNGYFDFFPGNGLYLDLDGSTGDAGILESKNSITFNPGNYELQFNLAGNQRSASSDTVILKLGTLLDETFILAYDDPFTMYVRTFNISTDISAQLSFENLGADNVGALLDNVQLQSILGPESNQSPIPEPTTMVLLASGLVGLAAFGRKRFKK